MAALSGTAGSVVAAGTVVGEMGEWSIDLSHSPVETTAFGDNWQEYIASLRGAQGSFSGNFDNADTMQGVLINSMLGGSAVALKLYVSTAKYFNIGTAFLTGQNNAISVAGKADVAWNFQVSGPVTFV
jgi:hypothetical protein